MRHRFLFAAFLPVSISAAVWAGCGSSRSCEETLDCPNADGAIDGSSDGAVAADGARGDVDVVDAKVPSDAADASDAAFVVDGCASTLAPKDDGCVLQDAIGVFVSPTGSDDAPGTAEQPVATVAKAVSIARLAGKPSVFVCSGTYAAKVELAQGPGINVFGGLSCPSSDGGTDGGVDGGAEAGAWTYTGELARFAPPSAGPILFADQLGTLTVLADLEIVAANATTPGQSSIAAFVRS